jgi:hypothetical protein
MKTSFNGFCGVPGKDTTTTITMPNTFLALHCALGVAVFPVMKHMWYCGLFSLRISGRGQVITITQLSCSWKEDLLLRME